MQTPIDVGFRRRFAVEASCDPRTIDKVLRGEPVRGLAGHRARAVLIAAGLLPISSNAEARQVSTADRGSP